MPYLLHRLLEVREILEEFSSHAIKESPILTDAYGITLYKCPIKRCSRFSHGFATRHSRDEHLKGHERTHKCTYQGCDYSELGFASEGDLNKHVELCHGTKSEGFIFPNMLPVSTSKALKDAIDRDDGSAIRDICDAQRVHTIRDTGFLLQAIKKKSVNAAMVVMELLGTTGEVCHQDQNGRTALHEAVVEVEFETLLQEILKLDVHLQPKDIDGVTPLAKALDGGHFHAVRIFLSTDKIDLKSCSTSYDPFMNGVLLAAAAGQDDIIQSIFAVSVASVPVSRRSRWISDSLKKAAFQKHESTVTLILELGQELGIKKHFKGILKEHLHTGLETKTRLLMERFGGKGGNPDNEFRRAAERGDVAAVLNLLEKGVNINYGSTALPTALAVASSSNQLSMMKLLLDKKAKVDARGGKWATALGAASSKGQIAAIQLLLEHGADPDYGIYSASCKGQNAIIELLLEKGGNINAHGGLGDALSAACSGGHETTVNLLLSHRAGIYARGEIADVEFGEAWSLEQEEDARLIPRGCGSPNDRGLYSALCVACKNGHGEIVQLLIYVLEKNAETEGQLLGKYSSALDKACAAPKGDLDTVQALLECGADPNYGSSRALQTACVRGKQDIIELLLEYGADVNGRDGNKPTALIKAALWEHENVVELLLKQGADVNAWSTHDAYCTALIAACSSTANQSLVQLLLEGGADVNMGLGEALKSAYRGGNNAIVQLLLWHGAKEM